LNAFAGNENVYLVTVYLYILEKIHFLAIQFLPQFGFSYRTSKPDIFDHPTFKTVHNWPSGGFDEWF
jgi:hypothetical protein